MPRYYVMLCTPDMMKVPIKGQDPYPNGNLPFSAGCPQFFGGGVLPVGAALQMLQAEVAEESRGTLQLDSLSSPLPFLVQQAQGQPLRFYYSSRSEVERWHVTGVPWQDPPPPGADAEMSRIVNVAYPLFAAGLDWGDDDAVLGRLRLMTETLNAPRWAEFRQSATAAAFLRFIRDIWRPMHAAAHAPGAVA